MRDARETAATNGSDRTARPVGEVPEMHSVDDRLRLLERRVTNQRRMLGSSGRVPLSRSLTMGAGGSDVAQARRVSRSPTAGRFWSASRRARRSRRHRAAERDGQSAAALHHGGRRRDRRLRRARAPGGSASAGADGGVLETTTAGGKTLVQPAGSAGGGALSIASSAGGSAWSRSVPPATARARWRRSTHAVNPMRRPRRGWSRTGRIVAYEGVKERLVAAEVTPLGRGRLPSLPRPRRALARSGSRPRCSRSSPRRFPCRPSGCGRPACGIDGTVRG